jgi:hypothetical protein
VLTHNERIKNGTKSFDIAAQKGKLDKNWRYKLDLKILRTYYWINNPLDQLFGSTARGLYITGAMGFAEEKGFLNYTDVRQYPNDATLLKEEWRRQLRTDDKWTEKYVGAYERYFRGLGYTIYWCSTRKRWG